jgi:amino acid transporter
MSLFNNIFRRKSIQDAIATAEGSIHGAGSGLQKNLRVLDLTALGIAAIIGGGIFSTIGQAAADGGPAVLWLYVFTAFACVFSALCYAQFASVLPVSGSAYTYTYTTFGEILAWIVGWNLLWEYAIGNIAVAISWSDYFTGLINGIKIGNWQWHFPDYLSSDYMSASRAADSVRDLLASGKTMADVTGKLADSYAAWSSAPVIAGIHFVIDLPALLITLIITTLVYRGIQESKNTGNAMVVFKLFVILMVIALGAFYITPENWVPFAPHGARGVLAGVSAVFFAYIGFDAISTTAEECKDPQRDLPRAMFYSLLICTVLYVLIVLILTGMVKSDTLAVGDPLAMVFKAVGLSAFSKVVAVSAVVATASVFLVFQLGQPRIWMTMSRDGLLPSKFAEIHPKYKTPGFSTIVAGLVVAIPSLFLNLDEVADLCSLGTLFAFAIVCAGVLHMDESGESKGAKYKVRYFNSRIWLPITMVLFGILMFRLSPNWLDDFIHPSATDWVDKLPLYVYGPVFLGICFYAVWRQWSIVPVIGMLLNLFMMTQVKSVSWGRFGIWMLLGFLIYFLYGKAHSKLGLKYGKTA